MVPALCECFYCVKEVVFRLLIPIDYGLSRILRKLCIFDNKLVEVVAKKVSASVASMAIEYSKEAALWPVFNVLFRRWLHDI
jgi:hypothetical protein